MSLCIFFRNTLKPVQQRPKHDSSGMSLILQFWENYRSPAAFEEPSPRTGSAINTPLHIFHTGPPSLFLFFQSGGHHWAGDLWVLSWAERWWQGAITSVIHQIEKSIWALWRELFILQIIMHSITDKPAFSRRACWDETRKPAMSELWLSNTPPPLPDLGYSVMIYCSGRWTVPLWSAQQNRPCLIILFAIILMEESWWHIISYFQYSQ